MFLITSITTLRERTGGTMERLMALPIGKLDLVLGYMLAFGLLAIIQATLASLVLLYWLGLEVDGPHWFLVVQALADALVGTALGIFVSAFAKTGSGSAVHAGNCRAANSHRWAIDAT